MTLKINTKPVKTSTLIVPVLTSQLTTAIASLSKNYGLPARQLKKEVLANAGELTFLHPTAGSAERLLLLGLGDKIDTNAICSAFCKLSQDEQAKLGQNIGIRFDYIGETETNLSVITAAVNGLFLGTYNIGKFKTEKTEASHPLSESKTKLHLFPPVDINQKAALSAAQKAVHTAETQMQMMDMVNAPGNKLTPTKMARIAVNNGKKFGFKTTVFNKSQITKLGLDAVLAVNRGSEYPPAFIIMEYKPKGLKKGLPTLGLVGKGVTFDTGGLSIKGATNMHYMKSDMGGAAAVLGAITLAARLQLPAHLIGIIPTTDNCVDANAIKPGDIINSYSGKTIEVIDTDAEGRLILADGLAYMVKNYKPEAIVDLATLTGSCVRALGYDAAGLFSNNQELANQLLAAGENSGERLWQLPIWECYAKDMDSDVADIKNLGTRPVAGAITAAKFLQAFIADHPRWAHLDIAGVAFGSNGFSKQKSATAYGVRLLTEWIEHYS